MGVVADKETIDNLYATIDYAHEGRVHWKHMERVLKWAASSKRSNVIKIDLDEEFDAAPLHTQIRDALVANAARVMDLFRELDPNMDGVITKREFEEGASGGREDEDRNLGDCILEDRCLSGTCPGSTATLSYDPLL